MDVEEIDREIDDIMYQIEDESEGNGVGRIKEESQEQDITTDRSILSRRWK